MRHPRAILAAAAALCLVLGGIGLGLEERLTPSTIEISGTDSSRANEMLREHFGDTAPFVILLRGPAAALDRQGPALIHRLRRDPAVTTLSPWDRGSVQRLRPSPRRALVIADFHDSPDEAVDETVPELTGIIEAKIHPPVRATQTGFATLSRAIQDESIEASEHGELIALPVLLIVLLLVFRSPVAAAIPLGFGAASVFTSRGLLVILTNWVGVDALALTVCTMMGLALGVDYSLLMVSRFREELRAGASPFDAAATTRHTAGRTTAFAGSTLILSMLVAFFVVPGALLASLAGTLALVVILTVLVASVVGPPLLMLLGPNVDRWRVGPAVANGRSRLMTLVSAALRRPAPVAALIGAVVLILASPAVALKTGPFSLGELPAHDPVREDAELISRTIGPGFDAPYVIVAAADRGPITEPERLAAFSRWQKRIAATPGVQLVIGPGQVAKAVKPLRETGNSVLLANSKSGALAELDRLGHNLGRAASGVSDLREGISQATYGAGLLAEGSGNAEEGALAIARGLGQATAGSERALSALDRFATGTKRLAKAQRQAARGALVLKLTLPSIAGNLHRNGLPRSRRLQKSLNEDAKQKLPELHGASQVADQELRTALQQLEGMTVGRSDPNYEPALEAVRRAAAAASGLPAELEALEARLLEDHKEAVQVTGWIVSTIGPLKELTGVAKRLSDGLNEIARGGNKLANGSARLDRAAKRLAGGLVRLGDGATALAGGLARLTGGTTELERGLAEGYSRTAALQSGLRRATVRVLSQSTALNQQVARLRHNSPGVFNSGYFVLSALDGAAPPLRERAAEAVDLENGGQAATLLIFPRYTFNSPGSIVLNEKLKGDAEALGREAGVATGVAGGAATLNDYSRITRDRIPYVVAAITLVTFLVLVLVLRALPLAAIAVGLNLATVGVAFGVLTMLFNVPEDWPLGGRDYVDAVGATMIFGVVFGLSIDYAVFLLVRMRERYDADGGHVDAVEFGLEKTARVITGAAAIMMAVFIAFAGAPIATTSQLGVGLTVAVLLDATVVRIVLLPALMLLLGDRVWWLPRRLDRVLPHVNV